MSEESAAKKLNDIFSDRRLNTWTLAGFTTRFFIPDTDRAVQHWIDIHNSINNPRVSAEYIRQIPLLYK